MTVSENGLDEEENCHGDISDNAGYISLSERCDEEQFRTTKKKCLPTPPSVQIIVTLLNKSTLSVRAYPVFIRSYPRDLLRVAVFLGFWVKRAFCQQKID